MTSTISVTGDSNDTNLVLDSANGAISDGTDGTNGTNGTNGTDGTNGTNGTDGTDGTPADTTILDAHTKSIEKNTLSIDGNRPMAYCPAASVIIGSYLMGGFLETYVGIPYAEQPIGPKRFTICDEAPRSTMPIYATTPLFSTYYKDGTITQGSDAADLGVVIPRSEDFLNLNVIKRTTSDGNCPVMVNFHGGGHTSGNAAKYPLHKFCQKEDIITVNVNYRLDALGFLPFSEFTADASSSYPGAVGNYGLYDKITALKWIQNNIAHFGGDPRNVTIFGESAGAKSVELLSTTPLTCDVSGMPSLFHKVIGQSGAYDIISDPDDKHGMMSASSWENQVNPVSVDPFNVAGLTNRKLWINYLGAKDANDVDLSGDALVTFMQGLSAEIFIADDRPLQPGPVYDSNFTIDRNIFAMQDTSGVFNQNMDRPTLLGSNSNEEALFSLFNYFGLDTATIMSSIQNTLIDFSNNDYRSIPGVRDLHDFKSKQQLDEALSLYKVVTLDAAGTQVVRVLDASGDSILDSSFNLKGSDSSGNLLLAEANHLVDINKVRITDPSSVVYDPNRSSVKLYTSASPAASLTPYVQMLSDIWSIKILTLAINKSDGTKNSYTYYLNDYLDGKGANPSSFIYAGAHAIDLVYLHDLWSYSGNIKSTLGLIMSGQGTNPALFAAVMAAGYTPTLSEIQIQKDMISLWTSFAVGDVPKLANGTVLSSVKDGSGVLLSNQTQIKSLDELYSGNFIKQFSIVTPDANGNTYTHAVPSDGFTPLEMVASVNN